MALCGCEAGLEDGKLNLKEVNSESEAYTQNRAEEGDCVAFDL